MQYIEINKLKVGDVLAAPVVLKNGTTILPSKTYINSGHIEQLIKLKINGVFINEKIKSIEEINADFENVKEKALEILQDTYNKIINFEAVDVKEIEPIVLEMLDRININNTIPQKLLESIKLKDNYTFIHSVNATFLSLFFGRYIGLEEKSLKILGVGSLLHDIGKIKIQDEILKKPSRLTDEEYKIIKMHPQYGYKILKNSVFLEDMILNIVLNHHERIDGSGYPRGLKGQEIDYLSQIVSIVDVFDALLSKRSYKESIKQSETLEYIYSKAGSYFDFNLVEQFKNCIIMYPDGIGVKLSNGSLAYVIRQNKGYPERPIVSVISDSEGMIIDPYEIDLLEKLNLTIVGTI